MSGLTGIFGRNKNKGDNEVESATGAGTAGTGSGHGSRNAEEARNMNFEGSTAPGARSGATGATGVMGQGTQGTTQGTGTAARSGGTGGTGTGVTSGTTSRSTAASTGGVSEGFRGLHITSTSTFDANHPIVGDATIVCDRKYYTAVEDRPIVKEIKTYIREHHPIEKEFVVETRPTGQEREQTQGRTTEVVDTKSRIVETTPADPCGGVPTAEYNTGVGAGATSGTTTGSRTGYGSSGAMGTTGTTAGATSGTRGGDGYGTTGSGTGSGARTIT